MPKLSPKVMEEKKESILKAAFLVFSKKGYSAASMNDIVLAAGVSKGGIYNYFESKEAIFLEIAERRFIKRGKLVKTLDDCETLTAFMEGYISEVLDSLNEPESIMTARFSYEFWSVVTRDEHLREMAQKRYDDFFQLIDIRVQRAVLKGEIEASKDYESMGFVLIATLEGLIFTNTIMGIRMTTASKRLYLNLILEMFFGKGI